MRYILETERLALREFTTDDMDFIIRLLNSPGWLEFIGDRNVKNDDAAAAYLVNGPIKSYKENGFGLSLVETKSEKIPIGMCGIINRSYLEHPDIGFAFLPEFTGSGYAYEIAKATMDYAKNKLKIDTVLAVTVPANIKSIKLLEKTGFVFTKTITFPDETEELMLFSN